MSNVSTASAEGKPRLAPESDLAALANYLESERLKADAATSVEEFLRACAGQCEEVCHA